MEYKNFIIRQIIAIVSVYCIFSFAYLSFSPMDWDFAARLVLGVVDAVLLINIWVQIEQSEQKQ